MTSKGLDQENYILSSSLVIILKDYIGLWIEIKTEHLPTQQAPVPSLQSIFIKLNIFLVAVYFLSLIALSLPPNYKLDCKEKKLNTSVLFMAPRIQKADKFNFKFSIRCSWKNNLNVWKIRHPPPCPTTHTCIHSLPTDNQLMCPEQWPFFPAYRFTQLWRVSNYLTSWQRKQVREQTIPFPLPIRKKRSNSNICAVC